MTPYAPAPAGCTAADLLVWWRQRARTDITAASYFAVCRAALSQLGTEADLRQISTLSLTLDQLAAHAAAECWAELPPASRHHQRLRLRRAVRLFHAAVEQHCTESAPRAPTGTEAVTAQDIPALMDRTREHDSAGAAPELIVYLASDETVLSAATVVLDTAGVVASCASPENLAVLRVAVSGLEAALAEAGVASQRIPATAAALTAYIHRNDPRT